MMIGCIALLISITSSCLQFQSTHAFVITSRNPPKTHRRSFSSPSVVRHVTVDETALPQQEQVGNKEATIVASLFEQGSHDELMYALGVNLARQLGDVRPLVQSGVELASVAKGVLDTIVGRIEEPDQRDLLDRRGKELNELITTRADAIREQLEAAGRDMLATMAETEGVIQLPSGVLIHILEHGPDGPDKDGVRPTQASTVQIHYHGTLADGTVFDSTLGGDPVKLPLASVISGWREGVLQLHEGETAMLGIPAAHGYGPQGTPDGRIPGGSALFFKVQLLQVLSAGVGGSPLLGANGLKFQKKGANGSSGLLGADGKLM